MAYPRIYNAANDMVDAHVAAGRGGNLAFIDPTRRMTYGELAGETNRMANLLVSLGLQREMRIALLLPDTIDFPVGFWGAIKAGITPVPLNTLLTAEQYGYILADARVKALVVSPALLAVVQPILKDLGDLTHVIVAGGDAPAYSFAAEKMTSLSWMPSTPWPYRRAVSIMLVWTWRAPLGAPVEPEE